MIRIPRAAGTRPVGKLEVLCALLIVGLYTASLFLPAFDYQHSPSSPTLVSGWGAFLRFPHGVLHYYFQPLLDKNWERLSRFLDFVYLRGLVWHFRGWLPNPLLWIGLICLLRGYRHLPWLAATLALLLGLLVWLTDYSRFTPWVGYYLWLTSMAVLLAVSAHRALRPMR